MKTFQIVVISANGSQTYTFRALTAQDAMHSMFDVMLPVNINSVNSITLSQL